MTDCFIHTFMRADCELCGRMKVYATTVYGQAWLLKTRVGWIFLGAPE